MTMPLAGPRGYRCRVGGGGRGSQMATDTLGEVTRSAHTTAPSDGAARRRASATALERNRSIAHLVFV